MAGADVQPQPGTCACMRPSNRVGKRHSCMARGACHAAHAAWRMAHAHTCTCSRPLGSHAARMRATSSATSTGGGGGCCCPPLGPAAAAMAPACTPAAQAAGCAAPSSAAASSSGPGGAAAAVRGSDALVASPMLNGKSVLARDAPSELPVALAAAPACGAGSGTPESAREPPPGVASASPATTAAAQYTMVSFPEAVQTRGPQLSRGSNGSGSGPVDAANKVTMYRVCCLCCNRASHGYGIIVRQPAHGARADCS